MGQRLTPEKVLELFNVWLTNRSTVKTASITHVDEKTVRRHMEKGDWIKKADAIVKRAAKRVMSDAEKRQARHAKAYQTLQHVGLTNLTREDGLPIKMSPKVAITALDTGIKGEREVLGEIDETIEISIKLPKGLKLGFKPNEITD